MSVPSLLSSLLLSLVLLTACGTGPADDDDVSTDCNLIAGDEPPTVTILDPDNGHMAGANDAINWLVDVEDIDSDVAAIELHALDLSDGTPQDINHSLPSPDDLGRAEFSLSGDILGTGVVVVRIEATDATGCTGDDQVVLCIDVPESECDFSN